MKTRWHTQEVVCSTGEHVYLVQDGEHGCQICKLQARIAELESRSAGALHESWEEASREVLLDGLRWQSTMTTALLERNTFLATQMGRLAEEVSGELLAYDDLVDHVIQILQGKAS